MKDSAQETIGWLLLHVARLHRSHINKQLAQVGLFAGQEQVLQVLAEAGSMTVGELSKSVGVRSATISKMLTRLASAGFIARSPGSKDARSTRITLTKSGRARINRLSELCGMVEDNLLNGFDAADRDDLVRLLDVLILNLRMGSANRNEAARL